MVRCPKCGAEVKYITASTGHIVVDTAEIEIVTDRGRVVKGHFRHECKEKQDNEE